MHRRSDRLWGVLAIAVVGGIQRRWTGPLASHGLQVRSNDVNGLTTDCSTTSHILWRGSRRSNNLVACAEGQCVSSGAWQAAALVPLSALYLSIRGSSSNGTIMVANR